MHRLLSAGALALVLSSAAYADAPKMPADMCRAPVDILLPMLPGQPTFIADLIISDPDATKAVTEQLRGAGEDIPDGVTGYLLINWADEGVDYLIIWDNCARKAKHWPAKLASPFPATSVEPGRTKSGTGA